MFPLLAAGLPQADDKFGRNDWGGFFWDGVGGMVDGSVGLYGNRGLCIKRERVWRDQ